MRHIKLNTIFSALALMITVGAGPATLMLTAQPALARDGGNGGGNGGGDGGGSGEFSGNPALAFINQQRDQRGATTLTGDPIGCNERLPIGRAQCRFR